MNIYAHINMCEFGAVLNDSKYFFLEIRFIFYFTLKNLSIFGCARSSLLCGLFSSCSEPGLLSRCRPWASHCGRFSRCRAQALGVQASVVVALGLSCPVVCGIFLNQGSNRVSSIGRWFLIHCATSEVLISTF